MYHILRTKSSNFVLFGALSYEKEYLRNRLDNIGDKYLLSFPRWECIWDSAREVEKKSHTNRFSRHSWKAWSVSIWPYWSLGKHDSFSLSSNTLSTNPITVDKKKTQFSHYFLWASTCTFITREHIYIIIRFPLSLAVIFCFEINWIQRIQSLKSIGLT